MASSKQILLIIDNAGDFISLFKKVVEREGLDREFICIDVIPSTAPLLDDCLEKVSNAISDYAQIGAVLIDIVLDEGIKPADSKSEVFDKSGLLVAAELRKRLPTTPILGMTQWAKVQSLLTDVTLDESLDGLLLKKILTSNGFSRNKFYEYLSKATKKSSKRQLLGSYSLQSVADKNRVQSYVPSQPRSALALSGDAITTYQATDVDSDVLDRILWAAFGVAEGTVKYLVPGFSGAKIFDVEGRINQTGQSQANVTSWILKVAQEEEKLQEEIAKHHQLRNRGVPKDLYPTLLYEHLISEGSWHALITEKEVNAQPLRSYMNDPAFSLPNVKQLIDEIGRFVQGLYGGPYRQSCLVWQNYYQFSPREKAAILAVLDENGDALKHRWGLLTDEAIKRVQRFATTNGSSERHLYETKLDVDTRYIHGDFHARNILINPTSMKITTIDFPNSGQDHAVKDFAKLETDIIFSVLDSRQGVDTDWASVENWQPILESLGWHDLIGTGVSSTNPSPLSLIIGIRSSLLSALPTTTKQEYLLALLSYSLKLLPYADITLPKKAFAIQYINRILDEFN